MRIPANLRHVTGFGLLALLLGLLVYDLLPATNEAEGDTISEVLNAAPRSVVLLAGFFLGHFWPIKVVLRRLWSAPDTVEKTDGLHPGDPAG